MLAHIPDHFSVNLKFDFQKKPAIVTDRSSLCWVVVGWFSGLIMLWLGIFELFSFIKAENKVSYSLLGVEFFAFLVILLALTLLISSSFSFFRYKKFYFDGESFEMIYRPAIGIKHKFCEPLTNYIGVRLRVLFVQSGLLNKTRYIIDLYHQDPNKIIPLYISTNKKNIRKIWESYAKQLNLPALSIGDRGLVFRDCSDLDKSLKELAAADKLPFIASGLFPTPKSLTIEESKNSIKIFRNGFLLDTFSALILLLALCAVFILLAGGIYLSIVHASFSLNYWIICILFLLAISRFILHLFESHILVITAKTLNLTKFLFSKSIKTEEINISNIKNIELGYNPTVNRYDLEIISDDKIINFGHKLPVSDLLWLKDFIIRKLTGN